MTKFEKVELFAKEGSEIKKEPLSLPELITKTRLDIINNPSNEYEILKSLFYSGVLEGSKHA